MRSEITRWFWIGVQDVFFVLALFVLAAAIRPWQWSPADWQFEWLPGEADEDRVWYDGRFYALETPHQAEIQAAARRHGLDSLLFTAQIRQESAFDPAAVSDAGARGLGQLMPVIINWCGISDPHDVEESLDCSARWMAYLLDKYETPLLALAAYNAGEPAVDACMCVPDNGETVQYVEAIYGFYEGYKASHRSGGERIQPLYPDMRSTQAHLHGIPGNEGVDVKGAPFGSCNYTIYAPFTAMVQYNGRDGYNHVDIDGRVWPQATMLALASGDGRVKMTLLHGNYDQALAAGDVVAQGERIGRAGSHGWSTGCHDHVILEIDGQIVNYLDYVGGRYGQR